mmetsp:Transcript_22960/g.36067  ORF Transcript_22960/g.36067 Transcript_22960/m.36067 type:complete len:94 (+) Transcript_22960:1776-2057(+)
MVSNSQLYGRAALALTFSAALLLIPSLEGRGGVSSMPDDLTSESPNPSRSLAEPGLMLGSELGSGGGGLKTGCIDGSGISAGEGTGEKWRNVL